MLTTTFASTMKAQLLKYACGERVFCPLCECVLDCQDAVLLKSPAVALCVDCFERETDKHAWRFDPDPYGLHGVDVDTRQAEVDKHKQAIVDVDGRDIDWDLA